MNNKVGSCGSKQSWPSRARTALPVLAWRDVRTLRIPLPQYSHLLCRMRYKLDIQDTQIKHFANPRDGNQIALQLSIHEGRAKVAFFSYFSAFILPTKLEGFFCV